MWLPAKAKSLREASLLLCQSNAQEYGYASFCICISPCVLAVVQGSENLGGGGAGGVWRCHLSGVFTSLNVPSKECVCVLQESLGGNAKTSLVIAVANAEDHIDESLQSLQFGSRAMRILTRAVVNERMDVKVHSSKHKATLIFFGHSGT